MKMIQMIRKILKFPLQIVIFIRYISEFLLVISLILISISLPFRLTSWFFGLIVANIGIFITPSNRIKNNLRFIYPLMDETLIHSLTKRIWFNAGRFLGETPHFFLKSWKSLKKYVKVENEDALLKYAMENKPIVIITEHIGNWWFTSKFISHNKVKMFSIFRKPNNPLINFIYLIDHSKRIAKGSSGMKKVVEVLKNNGVISIFQDHRDDDGIRIPLVGKEAATSDFFAKIAIKYKSVVVRAICTRDKFHPTRFTLNFKEIYNPDKDKFTVEELTRLGNDVISQDIQENRDQWFWLHRRWK